MDKLLDEFDLLIKQVNEKADEIINKAEDLKSDLDILQEQYDDLQEDLRENYKPINMHEFYGVNEGDF